MVGYAGTLSIKESRIYTQYYILCIYYDSIPKGSRYLHRYSTSRYARKEASDAQSNIYLHTLSLCRRGGGGKKVGQTAKRTIEHCETISRHAMVGSGGPGYTSEFLP